MRQVQLTRIISSSSRNLATIAFSANDVPLKILSLMSGSSSPNTEHERNGPKNDVNENSRPGAFVTKLGIN